MSIANGQILIECMCLACDGPIPRRKKSNQHPAPCYCSIKCRMAYRAAGYKHPVSWEYEDRRMFHETRRRMEIIIIELSQRSGVGLGEIEEGRVAA